LQFFWSLLVYKYSCNILFFLYMHPPFPTITMYSSLPRVWSCWFFFPPSLNQEHRMRLGQKAIFHIEGTLNSSWMCAIIGFFLQIFMSLCAVCLFCIIPWGILLLAMGIDRDLGIMGPCLSPTSSSTVCSMQYLSHLVFPLW